MMEMRFDENGRRYVEFSKNRRGGTNINKRLYFSLVDGELVWDEESWKQEIQAADLADGESSRRAALEGKFSDLFLSVGKKGTDEDAENVEVEADEDQDN